jgi:hypothetical protein
MRASYMEQTLAIIGLVLGICVSAMLAQKGPNFAPNLAFFWLSQLIVLALALPFRPRPAVIAGAALALAAYLGAFAAWLGLHPNSAGLIWLGYLLSLPGAAVGAIVAALLLRDRFRYSAILASCIASGLALVGVLINQTFVCMTAMACFSNAP